MINVTALVRVVQALKLVLPVVSAVIQKMEPPKIWSKKNKMATMSFILLFVMFAFAIWGLEQAHMQVHEKYKHQAKIKNLEDTLTLCKGIIENYENNPTNTGK